MNNASNKQTTTNPTAEAISEKLQSLAPVYLELVNESMYHAGYFEGKESHFKLTIASEAFIGKRLIARHQQIYALLTDLMTAQGGSIHALALHTYTPEEWQALQASPASPKCAGSN